jgi:hypothetical protein
VRLGFPDHEVWVRAMMWMAPNYDCTNALWLVVKFYPAVKTIELELHLLGINQLCEKKQIGGDVGIIHVKILNCNAGS